MKYEITTPEQTKMTPCWCIVSIIVKQLQFCPIDYKQIVEIYEQSPVAKECIKQSSGLTNLIYPHTVENWGMKRKKL